MFKKKAFSIVDATTKRTIKRQQSLHQENCSFKQKLSSDSVLNMQSFKKTALLLNIFLLLKCCCTTPTPTTTTPPMTTLMSTEVVATTEPAASSYNLFAADLFTAMVEGKSLQNIIYSPVSIQACLTLAFMGAEGETAEEMCKVLHLGKPDKLQIAEKFAKFIKANKKTNNQTEELPFLKMANRLYVNDVLKVSEEFNRIAVQYFESQAESINFTDSKRAVANINEWVAQQTESKIKEILNEDAFNRDTKALLINAIYFKAEWLNAFSQSTTSVETFYSTANGAQPAEIMYNEEYYGYAELPELAATALEMPYNNSDISMLIILPNEVEGLASLELKLKNTDLNDISEKMLIRKVHAYIPKFRIEFDIDLKEPLKKMGLKTMFSSIANFESLFTSNELQSISKITHKAFLDINEAGSEAAAATFVQLTALSGIFDEPIFRADHPFVFAILSKSAVYFAGHVVAV